MNDTATELDLGFLATLSVLYVEDEDEVREALARYLRRRCPKLELARNGKEGLEMFRAKHYDVVVTDVKMPIMDGLEMARNIKSIKEEVPVIIVTAYNEVDYFLRAIEVGVNRYVKKPLDPDELLLAIYKSTIIHFHQRELEHKRQSSYDSVNDALIALGHAIMKRNPYTETHEARVAKLAVAIAEDLCLPLDQIEGIRLAAEIHDIGNLDVLEDVLRSPHKLTAQEFEEVSRHPQSGFEILGDIAFPWPIAQIIVQHHERMDGSGYPKGLKGDEILLEARIVGVADALEAMTSARPHRPAYGVETALAEIKAKRGTLFDPAVVDSCVRVLEQANLDFWGVKP
ncbi:two-component system response regulator [Sulfurimicrobium lacus]|uniref:Two-component system response regulator n=1 Tax=Sulfurimicrobium lacus TaxID=2715678 RepID=A0A6F8VAA5_9PROT|nr:HD domain-containing phosphohydrolase [Sulfurimicrobium lacus]BCB26260.1 two-component system response regulator [Sulfurimicrobium lacus]